MGAVATSAGELECDAVIVCLHKLPNSALAEAAGIKTGTTGGIIVDERMRTSKDGVWAAGDVIEVPHGLSMIPIRGLTGSHAYAQGRTAAFNAAGQDLVYDPVWVPWGMVAGDYTIGGFSIGETLATAMGVPYVVAKGVGVSRARYFPGATRTHVKLLAEPDTHKLIGGQIHGGEGVKERADFLAFAAKRGATLEDIAWMENIYSPPIGALFEPMAIAAQNGPRRPAVMSAEQRLRERSEHYLMQAAIRRARRRRAGHRQALPRARRAAVAVAVRAGVPARAVGGEGAGDEGAADDRVGVHAAAAAARRALAAAAGRTSALRERDRPPGELTSLFDVKSPRTGQRGRNPRLPTQPQLTFAP